jgi:SAM-dependent MidA family methyltransferase
VTARVSDDFASITESSPLVAELRARIDREGPITFRDFMDAALYHPKHGYYRTNAAVTTARGDYVTSPEVHPVFGALVGRQVSEFWQAIGAPSRFTVVEQGAGRGLLARDILRWAGVAAPDFCAALRYEIVEPADALRNAQQSAIEQLGVPVDVRWSADLPPRIEGCLLTNELIDAFPVHRVVRQGDELREVYVTYDVDRFTDHLGPLSTEAISGYFQALDVRPGEGCFAEVNLEAPRWIADVASRVHRGFVLTFDYGYEAPDLYAPWRRDGTLVCSYRQTASSNPYQRIGKQDITASVDLTTLRRAGEAAGLTAIGSTEQSVFLQRLGITEALASVAANPDLEEYFARRNVVLDLIDPARLGRIKVLLQSKGVERSLFAGFVDA